MNKILGLLLITISTILFTVNAAAFNAYAQQGGAAEGGDATVGGPSYNCNVPGSCPQSQAPRGGDATGGAAEGTSRSGPEGPRQETQNSVINACAQEFTATPLADCRDVISSEGYLTVDDWEEICDWLGRKYPSFATASCTAYLQLNPP